MDTTAIVFEQPGTLRLKRLGLTPPAPGDVVVETLMSGVSTGTEKMLFDGSMPAFPGMGYPLVPGYESVARIVEAGPGSGCDVGETVFVPGASCYTHAAGLFGATAERLVLPGARAVKIEPHLVEDAVLLALSATAYRAVKRSALPVDVILGHGVLGRLIARIAVALGQTPRVVETNPERRTGARGYEVIDPTAQDPQSRSACIIDASGDRSAIDSAIGNLDRGGTLVLAGFYGARVDFAFAPAFMREISILLSAEFRPEDMQGVLELITGKRLSLKGLITHHAHPADAEAAYHTAFSDPACLKMVIDWRKSA